jgi:tryptophan halogenase
MPIPDSLAEKLRIFKTNSYLNYTPGQFFTQDSWYSILEGMNIRPQKYHPLLNGFHRQDLANTLTNNVNQIRETVLKMPNHHEYIQKHCPVR